MTASPPHRAAGLDWRAVLELPLRQFAPWLAMVLLATWGGYPGVVCVTPMAWLLALRLGLACARGSLRLREAALAGAFFGLLQGVLFIFIAPRMGPIAADEQASMQAISLGMLACGAPAGAGLSAFTAYLALHRQSPEPADSNDAR